MIDPPERSDQRDAVIDALVAQVPTMGWTGRALRAALIAAGEPPEDGGFLFPGGAAELVEAFCDLADRRMAAAAANLMLAEIKLSQRVRALLALRLAQNRSHKEAIRRAVAVMAQPANAGLASRCTARTVDAIWYAAGDKSADFAWYTKRASLAAVYSATLLYWLHDVTDDDSDTLAFLDRRLADLGRIGKLRGRLIAFLRRPFAGPQPST